MIRVFVSLCQSLYGDAFKQIWSNNYCVEILDQNELKQRFELLYARFIVFDPVLTHTLKTSSAQKRNCYNKHHFFNIILY